MRTWAAIAVVFDAVASDFPELFQAALTDVPAAAIDEGDGFTWRVFFHDAAERDAALQALRVQFPALGLTGVDVPDEDWAARSQANLTAVQVGRLIVAPPWDDAVSAAQASQRTAAALDGVIRDARSTLASSNVAPVASDASAHAQDILVTILPSMGFGTGHHATTRLCLAALQQVPLARRSVIDVGTGSGVLAIAASLLGAAPVVAVDDDPDAIQSARDNLSLNPSASVDLRLGDIRTTSPGIADVVIANLTGALLVQAAATLQSLLSPRGRLILSGLMQEEEAPVLAAFGGFGLVDRAQEDEWVCLVLEVRGTAV